MTDFLQLLISGMATGAIYALAALGFTLLWQASGTINFAQGEFVMLPAFMMLAFGAMGAPLLPSFVLTCFVAVVVLGWAFKRGIADPLLKFGLMPIVVATIGLASAPATAPRRTRSRRCSPTSCSTSAASTSRWPTSARWSSRSASSWARSGT